MWLSSIQRAPPIDDEKTKKKKESVVKYKSVDMYVGRPNNALDQQQEAKQ